MQEALKSALDRIIVKDNARMEQIIDWYSELLRLIEVGASCFNHYCVDYDDT